MSRLEWKFSGSARYMSGIDRGVFYPTVGAGVAWNGLTSVREQTEDAATTITYIDGQKIQTQLSLGTYSADIAAITYPKEFEEYDGHPILIQGQTTKNFNLSYRTKIGNNLKDNDAGYQIHLVYNVLASPTTKSANSLNASSDIEEFTWALSTKPILIDGARPSSHLIVDTTKAYPAVVTNIENLLYGSDTTAARFPSLIEILAIFEAESIFKVTDNGDGTATITGPDSAVNLLSIDTVAFTWPTVLQINLETYSLSSL